MKFSKRSKYLLLGLLTLLNVIIRLPMTSHENGIDSFYIHALSTSISNFGFAKWIIHPTSFFGLYPYSYPSAQPFILSSLSQSIGISIEYTILLFSIFLGLVALFSSFILSNEIFDNDLYSILMAFLYSMAPNFIKYTYWQTSTRGLFMAMFPLLIWLFLRYGNRLEKKYVIMLLMSLVFLLATHRVSMFLPIIIFAYLVALVSNHFLKNYVKSSSSMIFNVHVMYVLFFVSLSLFLIQFTEFSILDLNDYHSGYWWSGTDFISIILNMSADYSSKISVLLFFAIAGFVKLISKSEKNVGELFILLSFIVLLPFMGMENYSPLIMFPFLTILTVVGIIAILDNLIKWKKGKAVFVILCVIISTSFVFFMIDHWNMDEDTLSDETMASAVFIKDRSNGTIVANSGDLASKITAFSAVPTIPLGGPYAISAPPGQIIYGFVDPEKDITVRPLDISEIRPSTDTLYALTKSTNAKTEWVEILGGSIDMRSKYNAHLIIESGIPGMFMYWSWRPSNLQRSLQDSGNRIYTNGIENMYFIQ